MTLAARFRVLFAFMVGFQAILIGYLPLYFSQLGFSPLQIALIAGTENIAMLLGPPMLAARRYPLGFAVSILSALAAVAIIPAVGSSSFWPVLGFSFLSLLFSRSAFAVVNEFAVRSEIEGTVRYSDVRIWGSISFILVIYLLGHYADVHGVGGMLLICPIALGLQALAGLMLRDLQGPALITNFRSFFRLHVDRPMLLLYLTLVALWASHAPIYTYLSIHLHHFGWDTSTISWAWNICVLSEIAIFALFTKIERYFTLRTIIMCSLAAAVVRWTVLSLTTSIPIVLAAQTLHGFTYGAAFIATQKLVSQRVAPEARKIAQAVLMAISSGLGSVLGKIASGVGAHYLGISADFSVLFAGGAVIALLGVVTWSSYPCSDG